MVVPHAVIRESDDPDGPGNTMGTMATSTTSPASTGRARRSTKAADAASAPRSRKRTAAARTRSGGSDDASGRNGILTGAWMGVAHMAGDRTRRTLDPQDAL